MEMQSSAVLARHSPICRPESSARIWAALKKRERREGEISDKVDSMMERASESESAADARGRSPSPSDLSLPPQFGKCVSINLQGRKRFSTLDLCLTATQVQREALFLHPVVSISHSPSLPPAQLYPSIDSFVASTRQTQTIKGERFIPTNGRMHN